MSGCTDEGENLPWIRYLPLNIPTGTTYIRPLHTLENVYGLLILTRTTILGILVVKTCLQLLCLMYHVKMVMFQFCTHIQVPGSILNKMLCAECWSKPELSPQSFFFMHKVMSYKLNDTL